MAIIQRASFENEMTMEMKRGAWYLVPSYPRTPVPRWGYLAHQIQQTAGQNAREVTH